MIGNVKKKKLNINVWRLSITIGMVNISETLLYGG